MKVASKTYNIDCNLNNKIVLISDIHYSSKKDIKRLNYLLDSIKKTNPKFICIPGDLIDKSIVNDEDILVDWLIKLSKISKVIISIGNHEFYINKYKNLFELNYDFMNKISKINNLYLLDNLNIIMDDINFIGVTIPVEDYKNKKIPLLDKLNFVKDKYNILLCHSPINISNKINIDNKNIDLILCGHMHGGVVPRILRPIFKTSGLISPEKKLFPRNAYGHLVVNNTDIIITSGCKVLPITNIFKPEVVVINLINKVK